MQKELILKSDLLDIIFENRNKTYGAYDLRKFYNNRLFKSLGIMMGVVVLLSAFTFIPKKKTEKPPEEIITIATIYSPKEKIVEPEKPKETSKANQKPIDTKKFVPNIKIVSDDTPIEKLDILKPTDNISNVTSDVIGNDGPKLVNQGVSDNTGDGPPAATPAKPAVDVNTPIFSPEIMPSFPGGMAALKKFLQRNLTNPRDLEEDEKISVKIRFVVGYDGKLKSFETIEDGGKEFNNEVVRVLKKMPDWVPGKSSGQNVSVYYTIPVKFVIGN